MSQSDSDESDVEQLVENPIAWVIGGILSIAGFFLSLGLDPIGVVIETALVLIANSTSLFTAFSILGFTVAPNLQGWPVRELQAIAIVFGLVAVAALLDQVWERVKRRQGD